MATARNVAATLASPAAQPAAQAYAAIMAKNAVQVIMIVIMICIFLIAVNKIKIAVLAALDIAATLTIVTNVLKLKAA
jgi:hypothetical protein